MVEPTAALPPLRIAFFPTTLISDDLVMPVSVERLTDAQAREVWRAQEEAFVAHVRKIRTQRATPNVRRWRGGR